MADEVTRELKEVLTTRHVAPAPAEPRILIGDGFVQLDEKFELQVESVPIKPGEKITLKYSYSNRGGLPVRDVQTWGLLNILDPKKNPGDRLKRLMRAAAEQGYSDFSTSGATLGVGVELHSFAPLAEPFTEEQISALRDGHLALIFMVGGVWRDNQDQLHYWVDARQAVLPNFPELTPFTLKNI